MVNIGANIHQQIRLIGSFIKNAITNRDIFYGLDFEIATEELNKFAFWTNLF